MKLRVIIGSLILVLLGGCGGGSSEYFYVTTPNGLSFYIVNPDYSYYDSISPDRTHLYAIQVSPGFQYTVYLDTTVGDSDLYLYYDYTLSGQSLLGYSELYGPVTDSITFVADFSGTIYIEVYGVIYSQYLISVGQSVY
jgi:hypothetical protein